MRFKNRKKTAGGGGRYLQKKNPGEGIFLGAGITPAGVKKRIGAKSPDCG